MIKNLSILLRYFLFWLLFFSLERLVFIVCFYHKLRTVSLPETGKSFFIGLWMDTSMAGYITVLPLLLILLIWFIPALKFSSKVLRWYTLTLVVAFSIVCIFNFNIYREWGSKINFKALEIAFNAPNEAIASGASSPVFTSLVTLLTLIAFSIWLSKNIIHYKSLPKSSLLIKIPVSVFLIGLNILAIRGGWQLSPMNESMAYYSKTLLLNHAAVNTEWALLRDVLNNKSTDNPYQYYTKAEAANLVQRQFEKPPSGSINLINCKNPNVVFIILESFTADIIESLGGEKGITPEIEKLAAEGVLFENIYASGDRTDKGLVAILNAFPSQATRSIIKSNSKQEKLPSLSETFKNVGYHTSFYYGGEVEFFNMKSYLLSHSYQEIIDKAAFDSKDMNSKWGAHDGIVFNKLLNGLNETKQPFFSTLLTLTNHEPFEIPTTSHFKGNNIENKFRSTAYYTDSCLGAFINNARKQDWYKNTLFVIVADHGHRLPKNESEIFHPKRFRIPLLFFGEVIKPEFEGKRIAKIGGQTDIASTLLTQLKMESGNFKWSRDILNPRTKDFAFFDWDNGFGVANSQQVISFDNTGKNILYKKKSGIHPSDEMLLGNGKAYMQQIYQEYLDY